MDEHQGIAREGVIPWNIQADLKHFRLSTEGYDVIMGHDTYKRLTKPLRNRRNYVWCREGTMLEDGFLPVYDLDGFLKTTTDVWVIGGEATYREALPLCHELHITVVRGDFHCDQFFPAYEDQFVCISQTTIGASESIPGCVWSIWQRA